MIEYVMMLFIVNGSTWGGPDHIGGFTSMKSCQDAIPTVVTAYTTTNDPNPWAPIPTIKLAKCVEIKK